MTRHKKGYTARARQQRRLKRKSRPDAEASVRTRSVAVAHLRPGDVIQAGSLRRLVPPGRVLRVRFERNPGFPWDGTLSDFERSTSHLFTVYYDDGSTSKPVNGARRVTVARVPG